MTIGHAFEGGDWEWLAFDANGQVAVFTVAGGTPMPESFRDLDVLDQTYHFIRGLPVRGAADLLVSLERPDDYVAFAERGLFVYDWTDFHRRASDRVHRYELQARPRSPVHLSELSPPAIVSNAIWRAQPIEFRVCNEVVVPTRGFR